MRRGQWLRLLRLWASVATRTRATTLARPDGRRRGGCRICGPFLGRSFVRNSPPVAPAAASIVQGQPGAASMRYYLYNTDRRAIAKQPNPRFPVLIEKSFAACGGDY